MGKKTHLRYRRVLPLDRALSGGMGRQILIYLVIVVVSFLLLFAIALLLHIPFENEKTKDFGGFWSMLFYFSGIGLDGASSGNKWFVYLLSILGSVLMGGILIATLTNYLLSSRDKAENGLLRYRVSGHTVFVGYHEAMIPLVRKVLVKKETAVILSEQPFQDVKEKLAAGLTAVDTDRLIVYHGNRTNNEDLSSLCLIEAKEVYIFPELSFPDTDSVNLEVVEHISEICENRGPKLKCNTLFQQNAVVACFERSDVEKKVKEVLDFMPVIYGDAVTQLLLLADNEYGYGNEPLDRGGITIGSDKSVHLFIIGLGEIGQSLFAQAARQLHFPNFDKVKSGITLVGTQKDFDALKSRYREFFAVADRSERFAYLGDFLDLSVNTILDDNVGKLDSAMKEAVENKNELVTVAICLENSADALKKAISLPRSIYDEQVPVWLYKSDSDSLVKLIGRNSFYSNIILFGDPEKLVIDNPEFLLAAKRANGVYDHYYQKRVIPDSLPADDCLENKWEELRMVKKWSNLNVAYTIPVKQRSMTTHDEESDVFYRVEHNRWVAENLLAGYRPPYVAEREEMEKDRRKKDDFKRRLVHLDLCSYDALLCDAKGVDVREYDKALVDSIPLICQNKVS